MKFFPWKACGAVVLLVAAYVAGTLYPHAVIPTGKSGADGTSPGPSSSARERMRFSPERMARDGVRSKIAVPFQPGGAREWFLTKGRENCGEGHAGFLRLIQNCINLDEAPAAELAKELRTMLALYEEGDPGMRAAFGDDADQLGMALRVAVFRLSQLDPRAAARFIGEDPGLPNADTFQEMVFTNFALADPAGAGEAVAAMGTERRRSALEGSMAALTEKDPEAALALLSRFDDPEHDNERRKLVERMVVRDPERALAMASALVEAGRNPEVFGALASAWIGKDEAAAREWASAYTGPGELGVKEALVRHSLGRDPARAAREFSALGDQAAGLERTGREIARDLVVKDLPAARGWVAGLPPGEARNAAESAMLDVWVAEQPLEAAGWIGEMPAGARRDEAVARLSLQLIRLSPAEALEWADSIGDAGKRASSRETVLEQWRSQDPAAADKAAGLEAP